MDWDASKAIGVGMMQVFFAFLPFMLLMEIVYRLLISKK